MSEQVRIFQNRDYYARPDCLPDLPEVQEPILSEVQIQDVVAFEHQLFDLSLNIEQTPQAATYLKERSDQGTPVSTLHEIWQKKLNKTKLGVGYFLTDDGRQHLSAVSGKGFTSDGLEEAKTELAAFGIEELTSKQTDELQAKSVRFEEAQLTNSFIHKGMNGKGIDTPNFLTITKNPEILLEKARGYRELKHLMKLVGSDITESKDAQEVKEAKQFIASIYQRRINQFLGSLYVEAYQLHYQNQVRGDGHYDKLLEEIGRYLPAFRTTLPRERIASFLQTIDRFQQGVARNEDGSFGWLSPSAEEAAKSTENSNNADINRGAFEPIDPKLIQNAKASGADYAKWASSVLEQYGLLSEDTEWDSARPGPASDERWQVIVNGKYKSLAVSDKQRVLKVPEQERPLFDQAYLLEHELTHVLQHTNKRLVSKLKITEEIGADNTSMQAEAGALMQESKAREQMTGKTHSAVSGTSYMAAMAVRAAGGSFGECMQAFYKDYIRINPDVDSSDAAARAANRTQRLYRNGGFEYAEGLPVLPNTQPLHYLEQAAFGNSLKGSQRKILLVAGIGLYTLAAANRIGLMDINTIKIPEPGPLEIASPHIIASANSTA